ncbi:hypothetical protein Pcinc_020979 [Petrolisthes cinctipes]|uniref:Chitin-binding type-2 domain-containing protein n=1 Tax=Petrolisthes cinctipes TaxID=88211 RepID=A0AAE1FIL6_PETCI|nr:hypothetical protein Pcinc_020979 [Petrolisthes cinctipes]
MWKALLLVTVLTVTVKEAASLNKCEGVASGTRCSSCTNLSVCSGGVTIVVANCQSGTVCGEGADGSGSCYSIDDSTPAISLRQDTPPDLSGCRCSGPFPSFMVDNYDATKYTLCLSETNTLSLSCPDGQLFNEEENLCKAPPPTTTPRPIVCTEQGVFPVLDACTSYYACYPNPLGGFMASDIIPCDTAGFIFNPIESTCVDPSETLPAKPEACEEGSIIVPDAIECNAFYVCAGTTVIGEAICCPSNQVFNPDSVVCENSTAGVSCGSEDPCISKLVPVDYTPKCG